MTKKISIITLMLSFLMVLSLALTPIVLAEEANEVENETDKTSETFLEQKQRRLEEMKAEAEKKREEAKEKARQQVEAAKEKADAKKLEVRKKNCEARSEALKKKIENTSAAAKRHQEKIDWFNEKIEEFVNKHSLTVQNKAELDAAVANKAAAAEEAVVALTEFVADVNCEDVDGVAAQAVEYKALLTTAKTALKEYRSATKDLLVAVKTAAEAMSEDHESSQDDSSTTEGAN